MARKEKKLEHDYYLYSITINPKKPAEKKRYSEKDLRKLARDLKKRLGLIGAKVAIVFSLSHIHLSAFKDIDYYNKHGVPKIFADWHIHASMMAFDYDEIEHVTDLIKTYCEDKFGKFPTLINIKGYNCGRTIAEQEKLGYQWYDDETKNRAFYLIYQKLQQHGKAIFYNGTSRKMRDTRDFDNQLINNNMINNIMPKSTNSLERNARQTIKFIKGIHFIVDFHNEIVNGLSGNYIQAVDRYKKTGSEKDLQDIHEAREAVESYLTTDVKPFVDMVRRMGYKDI